MTTRRDTRLAIAERPGRRDHLHGAWWPYTTDIEHELGPMLWRALTSTHAVLGVTLNRDEWPGAPLHPQPLSTRNPKISWYGLTEPHLAMLHCGGHQIALLVVPPDTPEEVAVTATLMTMAPGNGLTTTETMTRARERVQPTNPTEIARIGEATGPHPGRTTIFLAGAAS